MRVVIVALLICAVAFIAGVASDLSVAAQPDAPRDRVTLQIPPGAVRAHPLPVLSVLHTRSAEAAPRRTQLRIRRVKPHRQAFSTGPKVDPILAQKAGYDALS